MRLGSDGAIALVDNNLQHGLTDLHMSKLTKTVLTLYSYLVGCCPISDLFGKGEPILGEA